MTVPLLVLTAALSLPPRSDGCHLLPELLPRGSDSRPPLAGAYHSQGDFYSYVMNCVYGYAGSAMYWPKENGAGYIWFGSPWASAYGEVTPDAEEAPYVSCAHHSWVGANSFEFWPSEGWPLLKMSPGETALEETYWCADDWYEEVNDDPMGVQVYSRNYSWGTSGFSLFLATDLSVTHHNDHGNPGVPLDAFCFSVFGDCNVASSDPSEEYNMDDLVFYDGHAIWCNDPEATFEYRFDDGTKASETDGFVYQQNPQAECTDPEDNIYYHYNYPGSDGIVDADVNSDGVSDHYTVLFKASGGDTLYPMHEETGLELFSEGMPGEYWVHTVGDTSYAVVPRSMSYMWDGDRPTSSPDDSGEPVYNPPCNGFVGWRLMDCWVKRADGTIERPIDVFGCPIPLSHTWWDYGLYPAEGDDTKYQYIWGDNHSGSGRHSGPAYLASWVGDPAAPNAFVPQNPGPFPIVQDNPLALGGQPFDFTFLLSMGPVDLEDGDTLRVIGGWVVGRGLADLRVQADNMLDAYHRGGGWGVPEVPPVPTFFYEASDGCVEMVWSDDAEGYEPFGGYRIYRSVFGIGDWEPIADLDAGASGYKDSTVTRGYPYYYALCSVDAETGIESERTNYKQTLQGEPIPVTPGWAAESDWRDNVSVVPNPYRGSAAWERGGQDRLAFTGLPAMCNVHIYTLSGDRLITLEHRSGGGNSGTEYWNLRNSEGRAVVSGLYVYCVESEGDQVLAKFAVIR
ncbi:hypothetical protein GF402_08440 [Candidatus Fermentibacteria bacterium]|nr:hypothetical protein [Candidatus Fermentibacteria bacterium]